MEHFLVARNPQEMVAAQSGLVSWFRQKIAHEENELVIIDEAVEQATKNKWGKSALMRQASLTRGRKIFYEKAIAAAEAGFTLIPNLPCDVFAIRVNREKPDDSVDQRTNWNRDAMAIVPGQILPTGEGDYKSDLAETNTYTDTAKDKDGKEIVKYFAFAEDYRDVQFPLAACRPAIMDAAAQAMALRIFDHLCISPEGMIRKRKGDPMIIGKILGQKVGYARKEMSFLITWFVDVRTL